MDTMRRDDLWRGCPKTLLKFEERSASEDDAKPYRLFQPVVAIT